MATWIPYRREGDTSYSWRWGDYEINPTTRGHAAEYLVRYRGSLINHKPRCLLRSRRVAERHATLANPDRSG